MLFRVPANGLHRGVLVCDRLPAVPHRMRTSSHDERICDRDSLLAFALYAALSIVLTGRALIFNFAGSYEGRGPDPSLLIWAVRWWPYAISHWLNPFLSKIIFAPGGTNIAWTTTVPLASLLVSPITAAFGPIVAYNCLALVAPVSAAWATFSLCRHLTRTFWPALLGGYIFGFSSYMIAQILGGHLQLVLIFPVPLALYFVVRGLDATLSFRLVAILTGVTLAVQLFISVEIFATMTLFAALALFLALGATNGALRLRVLKLIGVLACAYALALLLATPYIYYLFAHGHPQGQIWDTRQFSADLLNSLIPTEVNALGTFGPLQRFTTRFTGNTFERTAYFGPILIGLAIVYARRHWKEPLGRVLIDSLVVICVLSLGPALHVGGRELIGMPGKGLAVMPMIDKALPVRFTMYALLILAIIASLWLAASAAGMGTKCVIALLAVLFSLPNLDAHYWITKSDTAAFFSTGLYKKYIAPGENVVVTPYWILGNSMLWQAQTGMYFRMAGGWTGPLPNEYKHWPIVNALAEWTPLPDPHTQVMSFLANHDVADVIVSDDDPDRAMWLRWIPAAVAAPVNVGGVTLFKIPSAALMPYRAISAIDAERWADAALFDGLLNAAAKYNAAGRDPAMLTPFAAEQLGLIPPDWLPGPIWAPDWMVGTDFDPAHYTNQRAYRGIWLGYVDRTFLGIGISGRYATLKPIIDRYRPDAYRVYFPYPQAFTDGPHDDDRGLLLIFFDAGGLKRAIANNAKAPPKQSDLPGH